MTTSVTIRAKDELGKPIVMATFTSPYIAEVLLDHLVKQVGEKNIEILWCNYQATLVPGEQGSFTVSEFKDYVSKEKARLEQAMKELSGGKAPSED